MFSSLASIEYVRTASESGSVAVKAPLSPVVVISELLGNSLMVASVACASKIGASLRPLIEIANWALVLLKPSERVYLNRSILMSPELRDSQLY